MIYNNFVTFPILRHFACSIHHHRLAPHACATFSILLDIDINSTISHLINHPCMQFCCVALAFVGVPPLLHTITIFIHQTTKACLASRRSRSEQAEVTSFLPQKCCWIHVPQRTTPPSEQEVVGITAVPPRKRLGFVSIKYDRNPSLIGVVHRKRSTFF